MKRKLLVIVSLLMVCCLLPLNAFAGLYWGEIVRITSKSAVNVYAQPNRNNFIGEAMSTNTYDYLGRSGDWYHIQFTSSRDGYVPAKYSAIEQGLVWRNGPGEVEAVVRNTHYNDLNLRSLPDKEDSSVVGTLRKNDTLPYCGTENGWHRVEYKGRYVYVAANRTSIEVVDTIGGATSSSNCSVCGGSRVCQTCDGDQTVYNSIYKEYVDCPSCAGLGLCYACYDNR